MADTLLIHYNPDTPDQSVWSMVNAGGELTTKLTRGSLDDAAEFTHNNKVVMLLSSNFIHLNHIQLPTKNKQKLLNAAPFALEDQLADEIENLHFVIAGTSDKTSTAVACINKNTLDNILTKCSQANIKLDAILPDALCLTADTKQWAMLFFDDSVYIQQNPLMALSIERDYYKTVFGHTLDNHKTTTPQKVIVFQPQDEPCEQLENEKLNETEIINVAYNDHPLVVFCGHYKQAMPLNLLQNDYKPISNSNIHLKRWRLAAALAFVWMVIHLTDIAFQNNKLEASNQKLRAEIVQIYKDAFPKSKKIVNARVQMEQKLDELRSGGGENKTGFISILSDAHQAFSTNKDVTIQSISYRNNSMDITVTSNNLKSVEQVNKKLNDGTLKSEIVSSTSENNVVKGNIRIRRPNS